MKMTKNPKMFSNKNLKFRFLCQEEMTQLCCNQYELVQTSMIFTHYSDPTNDAFMYTHRRMEYCCGYFAVLNDVKFIQSHRFRKIHNV